MAIINNFPGGGGGTPETEIQFNGASHDNTNKKTKFTFPPNDKKTKLINTSLATGGQTILSIADTVSGLSSDKIAANSSILGMVGTFTSDGTVDVGDIAAGKVGYSQGQKIEGRLMVSDGSIIPNRNLVADFKPSPSDNPKDVKINSICYGAGLFVAVGEAGHIETSNDGKTWVEMKFGGPVYYDVAYGFMNNDPYYVAVADDLISFSADGQSWSQINYIGRWRTVAYQEHTSPCFVVISDEGHIGVLDMYTKFSGVGALADVNTHPRICYGNGMLVAVGQHNYKAYINPNGDPSSEWMGYSTGLTATIVDICFGDGKFIVLSQTGETSVSYDGSHWELGTLHATQRYYASVCYGNGAFMAIPADGTIPLISYNGFDWYASESSIMEHYWRTICYGNGKFVTGSMYGTIYYKDYILEKKENLKGSMITAPIEYAIQLPNRPSAPIRAIAYDWDLGIFAAVGDNGAVGWSKSYTTEYAWYFSTQQNYNYKDIAYGNGQFIAVSPDSSEILVFDGTTWSTEDSPSSLVSICYGNGRFVAVGNDKTIWVIEDGSFPNFSPAMDNVASQWTSVCYGNGKFVAVGNSKFISSVDGYRWVSSPLSNDSAVGGNLVNVCYGNGKFIVLTTTDHSYVSYDGNIWIEVYTPFIHNPNDLSARVIYGNGLFLCVSDTRGVHMSYDGQKWTIIPNTAADGVGYGDGKFIFLSAVAPKSNLMIPAVKDLQAESSDYSFIKLFSNVAFDWETTSKCGTYIDKYLCKANINPKKLRDANFICCLRWVAVMQRPASYQIEFSHSYDPSTSRLTITVNTHFFRTGNSPTFDVYVIG